MNRPAHRTAAAALAATLVLLVAGCTDDDDGTAAQEPTPTPVATAASTPSAEPSASASTSSSASPSSSAGTDAEDGQTITIDLANGKPTEKVGPSVTVAKGDKLTLVFTSDKAYKVHVHGVDLSIDVEPGETVTKTFTVDLAAGSYEVEVEETGFLLFNLVVK
ncbi:hypothetical protein [Sporichthya sp.]|uniref:hypothetical protein n=1 Tax=Sporichthya sp. TaxID=65475 RepID=UPI00180C7B17|nr:hypothetical protein [Sporichthya sp.]MBA3742250.1 hypothetical protein [Sporichthya sp.]